MNLQEVPLKAVPNQELNIVLDGQNCTITVRQIGDWPFFSLWLDDVLIVENAIMMPGQLILQSKAADFAGNFIIYDIRSTEQRGTPAYGDFGSRWLLLFMSTADIAELTEILEAEE